MKGGELGFVPGVTIATMKIINYHQIPLHGRYGVIVGTSNLIGRPVASMLERLNMTVTL